MKEIANLARLVTTRSLVSLPILDLRGRKPNKENRFVATLLAAPTATQLQVVKAVYGKPGANNVRAMQRLQSYLNEPLEDLRPH